MELQASTGRARRLRKLMTPAERRLWRHLSDLPKSEGHFRRQAPIGPYIVDFANHSLRLVIEVDGDQHGREEGRRSDQVRDAWLRAQGYQILRFWNGDILHQIEGVMTEIAHHVPSGGPPPPTPPHKGEGRGDRGDPSSPSPSMGEGWGGGDRSQPTSSPSPSMGEGRGGGDRSQPKSRGSHA
jgi:very-short-patch-repair endonuclease